MPPKPASPLQDRKEFFGLAAKRTSKEPAASEGLKKPVGRSQTPPSAHTRAAVVATVPNPTTRSNKTSSEQLPTDRSRSANRSRAPAVLPSDGSSGAKSPVTLPTLPIRTTTPAKPPSALKGTSKDAKKRERSGSAPKPTQELPNPSPAKLHKPLNPSADEFQPRDRIPVHLAADCEWSSDQVLAAEDRRQAKQTILESRAPGSTFAHSEAELRALMTGALPEDLHAAPSAQADPAAPAVAFTVKKKWHQPRKPKSAVSSNDAAAEPASKRPKTLWSRAEETSAAASSNLGPSAASSTLRKGKPDTFVPIKVSQAYYDAAPLKARRYLQVVLSSGSESSDDSSCMIVGEDDAMGSGEEGPAANDLSLMNLPPPPVSEMTSHASHQPPPSEPAPSPFRPIDPQEPQGQGQTFTLLAVRDAAIDGSCLFDSLAQSLGHILRLDHGAFNALSSNPAEAAIFAMTDRDVMRAMICDHLSGPFADIPCPAMGGHTPREAMMADYLDEGVPLHDTNWYPPAGVFPVPLAQTISSYEQYVTAMRKRGACGDEICLAASADLLGLRHIVFDTRGAAANHDSSLGRVIALSLDHFPEFSTLEQRKQAPTQHSCLSARRLSSLMPIILLRTDAHFDWMHPESDCWLDADFQQSPERVLAGTFVPIFEIFNPLQLHTRPAGPARATADSLMRPFPCEAIIRAESNRRCRREILAHLIGEEGMAEVHAEAIIAIYEGPGRHVTWQCLPKLLRLDKVVAEEQDPLSISELQAKDMLCCPPHCHTASTGHHSKFLHPAGIRKVPYTGPRPEHFKAGQLGTFTEATKLPAPHDPWEADFKSAVQALMVCANISGLASSKIMRRHANLRKEESPLGEALRQAYLEVNATRDARVSSATAPSPPQTKDVIAAADCLAASRSHFVKKHLGADSRIMTTAEIMLASKNQRREDFTGVPSAIVPRNLEKYWAHHQQLTSSTPRGSLTLPLYQQRVHRLASDALHQEACDAARSKRQKQRDDRSSPTLQDRPSNSAHPHHVPTYVASECDPGTTSWRDAGISETVPESARRPAVLAAISSFELPPSVPVIAAPPKPQPTTTSGLSDSAPFRSPTQPTQAALLHHSSPAVRLARDREERSARADDAAASSIRITVDTGLLPTNSVIWKQGEEKDGAGFNYHAFSGVKSSWEQSNSDRKKSYHTFKSFIDARFIGVICDNTSLDRLTWELVSDAELIHTLEEKLKPKDSTVYFVKVGTLRISSNPDDGSLSQRYRTFADAFLGAVNEAREAGTPLQDEAVKTAFKVACSSNRLLQMWVGAERWTTVQVAHQRIFKELQAYEALQLCKSLSEAPTSAAAAAAALAAAAAVAAARPPAALAAPLVAPAIPPAPLLNLRQEFSPEQRREHQRQRQVTFQLQQQQQQLAHQQQQQLHQDAIIANAVQRSVDSAWQRMEHSQPPAQVMPNPAAHMAAAPILANAMDMQRQQPRQAQQFAPPLQPHPGLDARGPNWHAAGPHLSCHYSPCTSLFCQGCGNHGHSSADCRRRNHPEWNASGYFSDRYPGKSGLQYATNPRTAFSLPPTPAIPIQQQPAPPQHVLQLQPSPQPRIAPPPLLSSQTAPFPTPHRFNNVQRGGSAAAPSVQLNASTQFSAPTAPDNFQS